MTHDAIELDTDQHHAAAMLGKLVDRRGRPIKRHRGIYLCGRPGRGKTMLMDRFFAEVDSQRKLRYHFHQFFAELHRAVYRSGSLDKALDALLGNARLVCFDEFHVHDIGDAMLIARLLDDLFARRIVLVVTSNYPPRQLLPNPLFHDRFVPTIERIVDHLDVVSVDGPTDYRTIGSPAGSGFASGHYLVAGESGSATGCSVADAVGVDVPVGARTIRARHVRDDVITIDFTALCATATSAADYVALAQRFRHWIIREVPLLREVPADWAMRFVNVIDVLYNSDRALTLVAAAPPAELLDGVRGVPDMDRIASRLCELTQADSLQFG
ncbi:cell division protein ZapE [Nocardia callitridis]|uniref:Cell division protein ZapE n=1 Tax=Nocardia callitridis TaxID=648753 RepID=A0ABP9K315_9NOCA